MKRLIVILSVVLIYFSIAFSALAQHDQSKVTELYTIDSKVRKGDISALLLLTDYLNDTTTITDYLGHHRVKTTVARVAYRLLQENTAFGESFNFDTLTKVVERIHFNESIGAYLLDSLDDIKSNYRIVRVSTTRQNDLRRRVDSILNSSAFLQINVREKVRLRNPSVLLDIAKVMYKKRDRYNEYNFDKETYTDAIALLTGSVIGIEDANGEVILRFEESPSNRQLLDYLKYWEHHYVDYKYDEDSGRFVNTLNVTEDYPKLYDVYELLLSDNDSVERDAFIKLTEYPFVTVSQIDKELGQAYDIHFRKIFLKQLCYLTDYCRRAGINYKGESFIQEYVEYVYRTQLTLKQAWVDADSMIERLTLDDISALEYWSLIYELNFESALIIDRFYSRHWKELTGDTRHLALYLKKSSLFNKLGIIGFCNVYLYKFENADANVLSKLRALRSIEKDEDIINEIDKILTGTFKESYRAEILKKNKWIEENKRGGADSMVVDYSVWPQNMEFAPIIPAIKDSLEAIMSIGSEKRKEKVLEICALAQYNQLDTALNYLRKLDDALWYCTEFIQDIFGIPVDGFDSNDDVNRFLRDYRVMTMEQLYAYYLKSAGIDIWSGGHIDYRKAYEALKFGLNIPFVGGGGAERDRGCFAVTKLLEIHFEENFGFSEKKSHRTWGFTRVRDFTRERRERWMQYLEQNKLVNEVDIWPRSFNDYDYY